MQTITKENETGYTWINDTDFQDCETLVFYLEQIDAKFQQRGFTVKANLADVRKAEDAYNEDMQAELDSYVEYE